MCCSDQLQLSTASPALTVLHRRKMSFSFLRVVVKVVRTLQDDGGKPRGGRAQDEGRAQDLQGVQKDKNALPGV